MPVALRAVLLPFLLSRGLIALLALILNELKVQQRLPALNDMHPGLFTPLTTAWDAAWYIGIARNGYDTSAIPNVQHNYQFFPLLPRLMRFITGTGWAVDDYGITGLWINHLAFGIALLLLYQLTADVFADVAMARRAVWIMALAPPAFVGSMVYTEPLFLCCSLFALWAAWQVGRAAPQPWVPWAGLALLGVAATVLTRAPGLVIGPAVGWLFYQRLPLAGRGQRGAIALLPVLVAGATFGAWVFYIGLRTGNPFAALQAGPAWGPGILPNLLHHLNSADDLIWRYGLIQILFLGIWTVLTGGLWWVWRPNGKGEKRPVRGIGGFQVYALGLLLTVTQAPALLSVWRYAWVSFPCVWVLARYALPPRLGSVLLAASLAAQGIYFWMALTAPWTP